MKLLAFAGFSGSGKTTLIERVIPRLVAAGVRVSLVKHAHHEFDVDQPGKDSYRHRKAGAGEVLVSSARRWALLHELAAHEPEPDLFELVGHLSPCDLVIVEGFKRAAIDKIEVHRVAAGTPPLHPQDGRVIAIAADRRFDTPLPQFELDDVDGVARFVLQQVLLREAA